MATDIFSIVFRYTKPQSFADCNGSELPYGWEQTYHPSVGTYFINHITGKMQLETF